MPSACQSLAWIINLILARCVCARVCVREKYWTPLSFLHSEQAEGGFSVTYCYLLLPLAVSVSPSLYLPVSPSPITDSLNRFLFSVCGIIPVTTEAPDNEILNSSHFLSLSASPAADAVPVRKDGDQVKCYYLLKKKKKKIMPAPFAAHLNLFFHFAESLCDRIQKTLWCWRPQLSCYI